MYVFVLNMEISDDMNSSSKAKLQSLYQKPDLY